MKLLLVMFLVFFITVIAIISIPIVFSAWTFRMIEAFLDGMAGPPDNWDDT